MAITFHIDQGSKVPPFEQIKHTVIASIESQTVKVDEKLPSIRSLAQDLGLAVNTVARAYRELEEEGYVITRGRSGTCINAQAVPSLIALEQIAQEFATKAKALGIDQETALKAVRDVFA